MSACDGHFDKYFIFVTDIQNNCPIILQKNTVSYLAKWLKFQFLSLFIFLSSLSAGNVSSNDVWFVRKFSSFTILLMRQILDRDPSSYMYGTQIRKASLPSSSQMICGWSERVFPSSLSSLSQHSFCNSLIHQHILFYSFVLPNSFY